MLKYNSYAVMKDAQQKEYNEFCKGKVFYAFNEEQFNEGMKRLGLTPDDTDKIYRDPYGCYILRSQAPARAALVKRLNSEMDEHLKDYGFLKSAFRCELANHEYCVTYDYEDALNALGMTFCEVKSNKVMYKALLEAKEEYLKNCEDW